MKRNVIALLAGAWIAAALLTAAAAPAHEGKKHFLGTVTKIDPALLTFEQKDGKTIEVTLTAATVYVKDKKPAKFQDLALGDRVVIHATVKGTGFVADQVEIAPPAKPKPIS